MLIYSAHIPHCPALLPRLGKDKIKRFRKTRLALSEIASDLYAHSPETVVFITPHQPLAANDKGLSPHEFTVNFSPQYRVDFAKFGDLASRDEFAGDSELALAASERLRPHHPVKIITCDKLDTATATAALLMTRPGLLPSRKKALKDTESASAKNPPVRSYKILPVSCALLPPEPLTAFGHELREVIEESHKRIALVSLGDLSRERKPADSAGRDGGNEDNPGNPSPADSAGSKGIKAGLELDKTIVKNLKTRGLPALADIDLVLADKFSCLGLRGLLVLLGALKETNCQTDILSYEQKFGAGLMAARFIF